MESEVARSGVRAVGFWRNDRRCLSGLQRFDGRVNVGALVCDHRSELERIDNGVDNRPQATARAAVRLVVRSADASTGNTGRISSAHPKHRLRNVGRDPPIHIYSKSMEVIFAPIPSACRRWPKHQPEMPPKQYLGPYYRSSSHTPLVELMPKKAGQLL